MQDCNVEDARLFHGSYPEDLTTHAEIERQRL